MRHLLAILASIVMLPPLAVAQSQRPWFFALLSDPQFGMYLEDKNFTQETANLEFVVANLNRLHPRFVVICGDLVNRTAEPAEIAEYKRVLHELDPSNPVHYVAGNHDVGNIPTAATIAGFRASVGPDFWKSTIGLPEPPAQPPRPAMSIHALYADAIALSAMLQFADQPEAAASSIAELDAALPTNLSPDDAILTAASRGRTLV
jgi:hypothetical protein